MKYRKRPVVVDAIQWTGDQVSVLSWVDSFMDWGNSAAVMASCTPFYFHYEDGCPIPDLRVRTLEGDMKCDIGDFIIRGVNGEFYPCKPDIFAKTYEAVS